MRTDGHDEANSRFSQFCERALKGRSSMWSWATLFNFWGWNEPEYLGTVFGSALVVPKRMQVK